jgi:hypothetical protein
MYEEKNCLECELSTTCEKAKHIENYTLHGCADFKPIEYLRKRDLIAKVSEVYQGAMNGFFGRPNDFIEIIENAIVYHKNEI